MVQRSDDYHDSCALLAAARTRREAKSLRGGREKIRFTTVLQMNPNPAFHGTCRPTYTKAHHPLKTRNTRAHPRKKNRTKYSGRERRQLAGGCLKEDSFLDSSWAALCIVTSRKTYSSKGVGDCSVNPLPWMANRQLKLGLASNRRK